ncbi:MAG: glycosyltransferase [Xanthobacteraceae bacterium]
MAIRKKARIPKVLHIVWIGDESKRPVKWLETWQQRNPTYRLRVWDNKDLTSRSWRTRRHMQSLLSSQIHGVADMMRWEILHELGGFTLDADTICLRPLPDWLFELESFACWEHELVRPGLISNAFVASIPHNDFFARIVRDIAKDSSVPSTAAWRSVGPMRLTDSYHRYGYSNLTILPSHFFMPRHFSGVKYTGSKIVYGEQQWSSTNTLLRERAMREKPIKFEIFGHKSWLQFRA